MQKAHRTYHQKLCIIAEKQPLNDGMQNSYIYSTFSAHVCFCALHFDVIQYIF